MKKLLLFLLISITLLSCAEDHRPAGELTDFLPKNSGVILKLQNPDLFFSNLQNNELVKTNYDHTLVTNIRKHLSAIKYFPHSREALLVLTQKGEDLIDFTFISKEDFIPASLDSIKNKKVETIHSEKGTIRRYVLEGSTAFTTQIGSVNILSSSRNLLEDILNGELLLDQDLQTSFKAASPKKNSVFINHGKIPSSLKNLFPENFDDFSNWTVLDTEISQTEIRLNGISIATDSLPRLVNVLREAGSAKNNIAQITPVSSPGFTSVTFKDFEKLKDNLNILQGNNYEMGSNAASSLLSASTETGVIQLPEGPVLVISILDPEAAKNHFDFELQQTEEYRGNAIFEYPDPNTFQQMLEPLLNPGEVKYFTSLDSFILFAENPEALKKIIAAVQSDLVLANTEAFKSSSESLSTEASLLIVKNNQIDQRGKEEEALNFTNFPITAVQFIYQDNFAHVHSIISRNTALKSSQATPQIASTDLNATLASPPVFFRNHRTKGMDVAVQDVENTLYLISPEGKIYWKKQLNSLILGNIETVDIFRNGRYQMAFATQNELHVIDRDGNPVKPFPLKFRDNITQPLAVFDYDNNKNYRFLVVQDNELYMYDRKGKSIKGFDFSGTSSTIPQAPKHIRIGRKDYIVIPETSGRLNILNRTGDIRVAVKENLDLTPNQWYEYNGNFISSNNSGQIIKITEKGNISREDLGLAENHRITATEKTLVTLSENQLSIKGNSVTLDFGLYTDPQIFYLNNKIYVAVTDLQAQKVYLFDSNAESITGFPVYGTSKVDLSNADDDKALELVVKGEDNEVLVYEVN